MDPLHKSSGSLLPGFPGIRSTAARAPGLGGSGRPDRFVYVYRG